MQDKFRIAIPKGSLLKDSIQFLASLDIEFEMIERKLLFPTNHENIEVLIVRPTDVAVYVERGAVDLGIVGSDILGEYESDLIKLKDLGYGECTLAVAAPDNSPIKAINQIPDYCRVATKFTNLAKKYFQSKAIPVDLISLYGSIEIAPLTDLSDIIVDLVGTGRTLRENGLSIIEKISVHTAHLVVNRQSWQIKNEIVQEILNKAAAK